MTEPELPADGAPVEPDIEINLSLRPLPPEAVELRKIAVERDAILRPIVQPRIEGVLASVRTLASQLETWHAAIADKTDLDLVGHSRASAVWLLSGRCLGLFATLIVQAEAGIGDEALVVSRALHEADQILSAFIADPGEDQLVRKWLKDEGRHGYVRQGEARAVNDRYQQGLNDALAAQGLPVIGTTKSLTEDLYDRSSRTTHNRRSSCVSSVSVDRRSMAYGLAPDQLRRAITSSWTASVAFEVANSVGDALCCFYGRDFFVSEVAPLIVQLQAVQETLPLDPEVILDAANLPQRLKWAAPTGG